MQFKPTEIASSHFYYAHFYLQKKFTRISSSIW